MIVSEPRECVVLVLAALLRCGRLKPQATPVEQLEEPQENLHSLVKQPLSTHEQPREADQKPVNCVQPHIGELDSVSPDRLHSLAPEEFR